MSARKILIVHPELGTARALGATLATLGYEVAAIACSGADALGMAARTAPDLMLMDPMLGADTNGLLTAERLRPIPIVFVAAEADVASLRKAGVAEPYGYLVTPFTDRELRATIELALCKHGAVREARELEDRFFAVSIDMLCHLDFSGYFKRLNPAWERTLGFTRNELMSRPFIEFVHPDDRERTLRQNREVREGGRALAFENRYLCKDGSYRWFLWNAAPDSAERVIYSVARDVTERKQAEDEREQLVRELQAALAEVRALRLILPICSYCRKIRDDENYWQTVESYIARHTNTRFSHGICPSCMATEVEPQFVRHGPA
jgi:PAS domain S-box-containing protein